jgi:GWxTD domain-containing protein
VLVLLIALSSAVGLSSACPGSHIAEKEGSHKVHSPPFSKGTEAVNRYVRRVFWKERSSHYGAGVDAYLRLLSLSRDTLSAKEKGIVNCHHRQLALILPDSLRKAIREPETAGDSSFGQTLVAWWRAQDPNPSTAANERLRQHLQRVARATRRYPDTSSGTGVDRRGEVFVRLGPPGRRTRVRFKEPRILSIIRNSTSLTRGDFPDNEYWVYPHIEESARYLFVKMGGAWEIGGAHDLVPPVVQSRMGVDGSGGRARRLGIIFEEIYSQLATVDINYSGLYQEAESATAMTVSGTREDASRMRQFLAESRGYERQLATTREQDVQNGWPGRTSQEDPFGMAVRTSRFLTENGTTHTVVDWGLSLDQLTGGGMAGETFKMNVLGVQYDSNYRRQDSVVRHYLIRSGGRVQKELEQGIAKTISLGRTTQDLYHAAIQWNPYRREVGEDGEERPRQNVVRIDSIRALELTSSQFEVSDLRLLKASNSAGDSLSVSQLENARPYPFSTVPSGTPLLLYFELYNLKQSESGYTRYTTTYEVMKRADQGFFGQLFGGERDEVTSTTAKYSGRQSRTKEYMRLDLGGKVDKPQPTEVVVRVTDEVTGQSVERAIDVTLVPAGDTSQ